jgi:hypothetical protein
MLLRDGDRLQRHFRTSTAKHMVAWFASTGVAAIVGPFHTFYALTLDERVMYWGGLIALAIVVSLVMRRVAAYLVPKDGLTQELAAAGLQTVTLGPLIWLINLVWLGFDVAGAFWLFKHCLVVLVICLSVVLVRRYLTIPHRVDRPGTSADTTLLQRPAFMERLPEPLPGRLRRVSANNHHLHIFTEHGERRMLMRFRDAMAELEDLPGFRIHRSHWVAEEALVAIRVEGRRHVAELDCGTLLPVSQANLDPLREAGLID